MDTELITLLAMGALLFISGIVGGAGGMVIFLQNAAKNEALLRRSEGSYDTATDERKMFIKVIADLMGVAERLAKEVVPTSKVTTALDSAEDILREITDGVPFDSKPRQPVVVPEATVEININPATPVESTSGEPAG